RRSSRLPIVWSRSTTPTLGSWRVSGSACSSTSGAATLMQVLEDEQADPLTLHDPRVGVVERDQTIGRREDRRQLVVVISNAAEATIPRDGALVADSRGEPEQAATRCGHQSRML